jgi:DNA-binding NarL/FixJ family response regulator
MVTPTTSVRIDQQYHQLVHDIVRAIKSDPATADHLRRFLSDRNTATHACDTAVLQRILERLANEEEVSRTTMAFVENISDRLKTLEAKALEQPSAAEAPPATGRRRRQGRVTEDLRQKARELRQEGRTYKEIAAALELSDGTVHGIINKPRAE